MTSEERLLKAFELNELAKKLFLHGLRKRFPDLPDEEIKKIYLELQKRKSQKKLQIFLKLKNKN